MAIIDKVELDSAIENVESALRVLVVEYNSETKELTFLTENENSLILSRDDFDKVNKLIAKKDILYSIFNSMYQLEMVK